MSQKWIDYRLVHNITDKITPLLGLSQPSELVWVPDTVSAWIFYWSDFNDTYLFVLSKDNNML